MGVILSLFDSLEINTSNLIEFETLLRFVYFEFVQDKDA